MKQTEKIEMYVKGNGLSFEDELQVTKIIAKMWISFGKDLLKEEMPKLKISKNDWEWFGKAVTCEMKDYPDGTESRIWVRSFARILTEKEKYVNEIISAMLKESREEWWYYNDYVYPSYDLIGYNINKLEGYKK